MNPLERVLQDDLDGLVDRLAAETREGTLTRCAERGSELLSRLEAAEARLSAARRELLGDYEEWRRALDQCADEWALADIVTDASAALERHAA